MRRQKKCDWLLRHRGLLNDWELDFVATLAARFELGEGISPRQAQALDRTFIKVTNMVEPCRRPADVLSLDDRRARRQRDRATGR